MNKKILFYVLYFFSPLILICTLYFSNTDKYSDSSFFIPMTLGAIAYTWLIYEVVLSARPKLIERQFGLDKLYRFHSLMAAISVILVLIHKLIEEDVYGESFVSEIGDKAFIIFVAIIIFGFVFIAETLVSKFKALSKIKKFLAKFNITKYEIQIIIHNISIIALILLFVHVLYTTSSRMSIMVRSVYIIYFAIGTGFYIYHKILKKVIFNKEFIIQEIIPEANKMWTLKMIPKDGKIFNYKPGQFVFTKIFGENLKVEEHPFSISSSPTNSEYLTITIKELGDFTSDIKNVKVGDKVSIDGPYGKFSYIEQSNNNDIVIISGGIGITPALSMIRHMYEVDKDRKVMLLWGINNTSDLICNSEFREMQNEMKNFTFVPVLFKDDTWEGEKGIIDKERIENMINKYGFNLSSSEYYICGPSIMLNGVLKSLKELKVNKKRMHYEKFSL